MSFFVPKPVIAGLAKLVRFDQNERNTIAAAVKTAPLTTDPAKFASVVKEKYSGEHGDDVSDAMLALLSLLTAKEATDMEPDEFFEAVFDSVSESSEFENVKEDEFEKLVDFVKELLSIESAISTAAKAIDLLSSQESLIDDCRVFTDIRPVFTGKELVSPENAVVYHNLKIDCIKDGEMHTLYLSATDKSLTKMQESIERAVKKSALIREMLKKIDIACFPG